MELLKFRYCSDLQSMPPYASESESESDTNSESSSRMDDDNDSSSTDGEPDDDQPYHTWDEKRRAYVNTHGSTIFWMDGSCKGNHLGPDHGATSGVGVWVHDTKYWKKFNYVYDHTNNVSVNSTAVSPETFSLSLQSFIR